MNGSCPASIYREIIAQRLSHREHYGRRLSWSFSVGADGSCALGRNPRSQRRSPLCVRLSLNRRGPHKRSTRPRGVTATKSSNLLQVDLETSASPGPPQVCILHVLYHPNLSIHSACYWIRLQVCFKRSKRVKQVLLSLSQFKGDSSGVSPVSVNPYPLVLLPLKTIHGLKPM